MSDLSPKQPNRWRERLQVAAQLAAIGSFIAAVTMASIHLGYLHPASSDPIDILSVGNILRK